MHCHWQGKVTRRWYRALLVYAHKCINVEETQSVRVSTCQPGCMIE